MYDVWFLWGPNENATLLQNADVMKPQCLRWLYAYEISKQSTNLVSYQTALFRLSSEGENGNSFAL